MKTYKQFLEACWKGYIQVGMKDKGGRQVPNCVPNPDGKIAKQKKEDKEIPKGYHRMPDGTLMKNSDHPKKDTKEALSPAAKRSARLKRKNAYLRKTMAKYGQASKMGIPASQVNQRRSSPTRKKT